MNHLKYVSIIFVVCTCSCVSKNYINNEDNRYQIYSAIIDGRSHLEKTPWYEDKEIPATYSTEDSLSIYLRYKDSMKILMKKKKFYILINDTTIDCTVEMQELKDSVNNNKLFYKEYFNGDLSFKSFILNWRPISPTRKKISLEKLTPTFRYRLSHIHPKNENDYILASLNFSDVTFDSSKTKAIVYLIDKGGFFYFLEKINNQWFIKNSIVTWTIE